jgi:prolyl-tRNA synthetase
VPLRIEIGRRDLAAAAVTVVRRDTAEKQQTPLPRVRAAIETLLARVQTSLLRHARDEQERRTLHDPSSYDEMIDYLREPAGFVRAPWCGGSECEAHVKDDSAATIRCLPLGEQPTQPRACVCCARPAPAAAVWAQAY